MQTSYTLVPTSAHNALRLIWEHPPVDYPPATALEWTLTLEATLSATTWSSLPCLWDYLRASKGSSILNCRSLGC